MPDPILIEPYDSAWPIRFADLARALRSELGSQAQRIDHVGSTAVPGLAGKPVIDIQISVSALDPVEAYAPGLARLGFAWRADNPDLTKRYFREAPGRPRTHIHVRRTGSWPEQLNLLFRDFLRADAAPRLAYAVAKNELARRFRDDRDAYQAAKGSTIWAILQRADAWVQDTGWEPGPSDA